MDSEEIRIARVPCRFLSASCQWKRYSRSSTNLLRRKDLSGRESTPHKAKEANRLETPEGWRKVDLKSTCGEGNHRRRLRGGYWQSLVMTENSATAWKQLGESRTAGNVQQWIT